MPEYERQLNELDDYYASLLKRDVLPAELIHDYSKWGIERYEGWAPDIEWIIEDVLPVTPGLIASMGGVGKSFLMLDAAIRIAAGPGAFGQWAMGGRVRQQGKVLMVTAEDNKNAIHRRLNSIMSPDQHKKLEGNLFIVPLPDAGGTRPLLECVGGQYMMTAAWDDFCNNVIKMGVLCSFIDPWQAMVAADANDPAAGQCYWSSVSQLCAETKSAHLTSHHMRKQENIDGIASARAAIRGSSALVDGSRLSYALWPATHDDRLTTEQLLGTPLGPLDLVQGAVVKSNDFGMSDVATYVRDRVSGLLIDCSEQLAEQFQEANTLPSGAMHETALEATVRWDRGQPFSKAPQSDRWIGAWVMHQFKCSRPVAIKHVKEWVMRGELVQEWCNGIRSNGLRGR